MDSEAKNSEPTVLKDSELPSLKASMNTEPSKRKSKTPIKLTASCFNLCRFCGRQFDNMEEMQVHCQTHFSEKPPHVCYVCGKMYSTPSKLQRHVRVHSGERPYACSICGKRFTRSDHVKQHLKVHMPQRQKNVCRMCGMKFMRRQTLQVHLKSHGLSQIYTCNRCGEAFDCGTKLLTHKGTHEDMIVTNQNGEKIAVKFDPEATKTDCEPVNGIAKFGLGPQPDVKESLDGFVRKESNNPAVINLLNIKKEHGDMDYSNILINNDNDVVIEGNNDMDNSGMSISSYYSLAGASSNNYMDEGNSESMTDGGDRDKMIVIQSNDDEDDRREDNSNSPDFNGDLVNGKDDGEGMPETDDRHIFQSAIPKVEHKRLAPRLYQPSHRKSLTSTSNSSVNNITSNLGSATPVLGQTAGFFYGKRMTRCNHCCIWFEDSSMSMLHMSLHSADETDPFKCKKCLKRLGNRLEFMAHIVWHLDSSLGESNYINI
ncbi:hypothetical protein SNE40_021926 [Patella caerulea]|uniref:C2H2-type domain-containing protein n=1 Tax=Patella caerulea TaxID=87958 RepID=A0AAN8J0S5_PATCE